MPSCPHRNEALNDCDLCILGFHEVVVGPEGVLQDVADGTEAALNLLVALNHYVAQCFARHLQSILELDQGAIEGPRRRQMHQRTT